MSDVMTHHDQWTELEGLAKAAGMTLSQNAFGDGAGAEWVRYRRASEPSTVLALIAENRTLRSLVGWQVLSDAVERPSVGIAAGDEPSPPRSISLSGEAVGWRPIETAPKDGSVFLVAYTGDAARRLEPHQRVYEARWNETQQTWTARNGFLDHTHATHWMPLPPAPSSQGGGGDQ